MTGSSAGGGSPGTATAPVAASAAGADPIVLIESIVGSDATRRLVVVEVIRDELGSLSAGAPLLAQPGMAEFLRRRVGKSRTRFDALARPLLRLYRKGAAETRVAELARTFASDLFVQIERSYYRVPVDHLGAALFDEATLLFGEHAPGLLDACFELFRSVEFSYVRAEYAECDGCRVDIVRALLQQIESHKTVASVREVAKYFAGESVGELIRVIDDADERREFVEKLADALIAQISRHTLIDTIAHIHRKHFKKPSLALKRVNQLWPVLVTMDDDDARDVKSFVEIFLDDRDKLVRFVWDTVAELPAPHAQKAIALFASAAFVSVMRRFQTNPSVLILLIRNLLAALTEIEVRDLDLAIFPVVMKLLLKLNIEPRFLERRSDFFKWLKTETSSTRVELEVIRYIFFEYIFIATKIVPPTRPQEMTRFCDNDHRQFCAVVDGPWADPFRRRSRDPDKLFGPILLRLRDITWSAIDEKFPRGSYQIAEIRSIAEDRDREDDILAALEALDPGNLDPYHETLVDAFRTSPDDMDYAMASDYWCRVDFETAGTHVRGAILPLVGSIPIEPADREASTDGRVIRLPDHISYFTDPLDPLDQNRNLTVYVALGLHEAGHIIAGSFRFNFGMYAGALERPDVFHHIYNAFEDYRIEEVLFRLRVHPQAYDIISTYNRYMTLKIAGLDVPLVPVFLLHTTDTARGYETDVMGYPEYREQREKLLGAELPTGRFRSIGGFFDYVVDRLRAADVANPLVMVELSRECYDIFLTWPPEAFLGGMDVYEEHKPSSTGFGGVETAPLSDDELSKLYREYNENPEQFLDDHDLERLKDLVPKRPGPKGGADEELETVSAEDSSAEIPAEGDAGRSGGPTMGQQTIEMLDSPTVGEDYLTEGTTDFATRTRMDDLVAESQLRATKRARRRGGKRKWFAKSPRKGKKGHVYSIDPKTKSRTRLSEIREFPVSDIDPDYLHTFARWSHISTRVMHVLAEVLPRTEEEHETSSVDGDLNMSELIEVLSGENPVGSFDFLDAFQDARRSLEAIIGIDISGSTATPVVADVSLYTRDTPLIIDVEKAFAMILAEALEYLSPKVSVYAFNSETSTNVYRATTIRAVSSFESDHANRDGDFIRYIGRKLESSSADVRYFFLISDGQPAGPNYYGAAALNDTVIAMREVVRRGVKLIYLNVDAVRAEYFDLFTKEATYAEHFTSPEQLLTRIPKLVEAVVKSVV